MQRQLIYDPDGEIWQIEPGPHSYHFHTTRQGTRNFRHMIVKELEKDYTEFIGDDRFFEFQYAFFEIVNNAVSKGNCFAPDKVVSVTYHMDAKVFKLLVEDEGKGFNISKWNYFYKFRKDKERYLNIGITRTGETNIEKKFLEDSSFNKMDKEADIDILDTVITGGTGLISALEYYDRIFYNKEDVDPSKNTKVLAVKFSSGDN